MHEATLAIWQLSGSQFASPMQAAKLKVVQVAVPENSRLIYAPDLVNGHSLSLSDQPYLWDLLRSIRGKSPLTLIVGAGVSMESGLPSWGELVSRLISEINDADLEFFVSNAKIDLLRRADVAVALLDRHDPVDMKLLLRNALFPESSLIEPGPLALAIGRLAALRKSEIRIITTNYDTLLEQAIEQYTGQEVESFSLLEIDCWHKRNSERRPAVLHVHGLVGQDGISKEPIVLTESEFLKNGALVRKVIADSLVDSMGLLLGLSITDPNLVGPLHETKDAPGRGPRFSLNVIGPVVSETEDAEKAAKFHVEAARYLCKLDLKPILLKSFSQLNQAVSDLALSIAEPKRYSKRPPKGELSLVYGKRFNRVLADLYTGLGCGKDPYVPTGDASKAITLSLRSALTEPERFLNDKIREYGRLPSTKAEHFQLCLWLRRHDRVSSSASYSLELLGSSTFQNYEPWALRRDVKIASNSNYAAAQAVYRGLSVSTNLDPQNNAGIWKGVLAIPIRLAFQDSADFNGAVLDQLTVGSLTIDSTHCVTDIHNDGSQVSQEELGIVARLHKRDTDTLIDLLYDALPNVLFRD